ncbi:MULTISPECIES: metal-sensitive transcriptional regulator [Lactobacillaceae]|uniref:metal-sensitive transcriptional regulator n=1 Tax=Lactobacillaceae TaxID=33958 RepID=UPI001F5079FC|nr:MULTISPECIES: metal-sensitive transcriptional regulator [Lactobacillaceae]
MDCDSQVLNRLKRIEGQARGVQKMLEDQRECSDVLTQLTAIESSIKSVKSLIVKNHVEKSLDCSSESITDSLDLISKL